MSSAPKSPSSGSTAPKTSKCGTPGAEVRGFSHFAARTAAIVGSSPAFLAAVVLIAVWVISGPYFHFSDSWQLVINTTTTIVTFLIVFLIQNTQNRDARALHLKLDEVIRALHPADNEMIDVERLSDKELERLAQHYEHIRQASEARKTSGRERHAQEKHPQKNQREEEKQGEQRKAG